jgi:hypothetical protein
MLQAAIATAANAAQRRSFSICSPRRKMPHRNRVIVVDNVFPVKDRRGFLTR